MNKDVAIDTLAMAASLTLEETDHKLLVYCYRILTGQLAMLHFPSQVLAYAKQAANEEQFHRRMAAYCILEERDHDALRALDASVLAKADSLCSLLP